MFNSIGALCRLIIKMLVAVFLLSFFIGFAICEDDQTMALVCSGFQMNTSSQLLIKGNFCLSTVFLF